MIDIKIGETYTTPGGVVVKAEASSGVYICDNCDFSGRRANMRRDAGIGCEDVECLYPPRVFVEVPKPEETPASSVPLPSLAKMDDAFKRHVLSVARAEFAALFWDMPNTDLAAAMGVTEKTVRNIRKKRLRKNKESL